MTTELRRARFGASLIFAAFGGTFATWASRIPAIQERLGLSASQLAVAVFGLAAGSVLALLASGPIIALLGTTRSVLLGGTVMASALPLIFLSPNLFWLTIALALFGTGNSLIDVAINAIAAQVEKATGDRFSLASMPFGASAGSSAPASARWPRTRNTR
jgi:predicted MFS family arabinose efflux permease